MSLDTLNLKPVYFIPNDNISKDVLIPALDDAIRYDIMTAFFTSGAIREIAPGLAKYISNDKQVRLVISPYLSKKDKDAIQNGIKYGQEVLEEALRKHISDSLISHESLVKFTLQCISLMIAKGDIDIRLAIMKRGGMFHKKVTIISDGPQTMVIHGSTNFTPPGLTQNGENARVEVSWGSSTEKRAVEMFCEDFESVWNNNNQDSHSFEISEGFKQELIKDYKPYSIPTIKDYQNIIKKPVEIITEEKKFCIPDYLDYQSGPYAHQGKAVDAWLKNDYRGIFQMCTGSGKTIAALICAYLLFEINKSLLIVISAPYLPLIHQWSREAEKFGLKVLNTSAAGNRNSKLKKISRCRQSLQMNVSDVECMVVTNDLLCDDDFQNILKEFSGDILLISDEVHHLGTDSFISNTPDFIKYRIGLSATPIRQYDEEGTDALIEYFGEVVFKFDLKDGIGKCLVPYNYLIHLVELADDELSEWNDLTDKLKKIGWKEDDEDFESYVRTLLNKRRLVLEAAEGKISLLRQLLSNIGKNEVKHTLIYATDKKRSQLEEIHNVLMDDLGILFHQITAEETSTGISQEILDQFSNNSLQVVTAMRVLDEGIDIPQVSEAFLLASTTVERQWVQRRGRVLRPCKETNKTEATIHDFVVVAPPDETYSAIHKSELKRVYEFAGLAQNAYKENCPIRTIDSIMNKT